MNKLALMVLLAATVSTPAFAGDFYLAAAVGRSDFDIQKSDIDDALRAVGVTGISSSFEQYDTAYKVQVGYQFTEYFALEGGYVDLGKSKYSASFTGGNGNGDIKASGANIAVVGILPLHESFSIFGKLGLINAKVETTVSANGPGGSASASTSSTKGRANWGFGATYHVNRQLGVRVEYEQFNKLGDDNTAPKKFDAMLVSAGVVYKF
jgi:OmpA-OmpF porin, OOP family